MMLNKATKNMTWRKDSLFNSSGETKYLPAVKETRSHLLFSPLVDKELNVKPLPIKICRSKMEVL